MGTKIRSEVSKKKEYWLPKHRHLELVHFCLQYPGWKADLNTLDGFSLSSRLPEVWTGNTGLTSKPVERIVEKRLEISERIAMIEKAAEEAAFDLSSYLIRGVTEGIGYDALGIPCCKDVYYRIYRRFFWILDKARK